MTGPADGRAVLADPSGATEMGRPARAHVVAEHDHTGNMDRYTDLIRVMAARSGTHDRIGATRP